MSRSSSVASLSLFSVLIASWCLTERSSKICSMLFCILSRFSLSFWIRDSSLTDSSTSFLDTLASCCATLTSSWSTRSASLEISCLTWWIPWSPVSSLAVLAVTRPAFRTWAFSSTNLTSCRWDSFLVSLSSPNAPAMLPSTRSSSLRFRSARTSRLTLHVPRPSSSCLTSSRRLLPRSAATSTYCETFSSTPLTRLSSSSLLPRLSSRRLRVPAPPASSASTTGSVLRDIAPRASVANQTPSPSLRPEKAVSWLLCRGNAS